MSLPSMKIEDARRVWQLVDKGAFSPKPSLEDDTWEVVGALMVAMACRIDALNERIEELQIELAELKNAKKE